MLRPALVVVVVVVVVVVPVAPVAVVDDARGSNLNKHCYFMFLPRWKELLWDLSMVGKEAKELSSGKMLGQVVRRSKMNPLL